MTQPVLVSLTDAEAAYGGRRALGPFSLSVAPGEIVAIVGPSGCGKSTALRLLAGLEAPTAGRAERELGRGEAAFVFQAPTLLPWATVIDNVALPLRLAGLNHAAAASRAREALAEARLPDVEALKPAQLSGGMAMRASLARALVTNPRLMLLDEPFAALDDLVRRALLEDLHRIWAARAPAIVFVTHNIEEAVHVAHRVVVLCPGPGQTTAEVTVEGPLPRPAGFRSAAAFRAAAEGVAAALAGPAEAAMAAGA